MLTIFGCPKPFDDPHIAIIQRNAIQSWLKLPDVSQIILFGSEPGTGAVCREFDLWHSEECDRNVFGTPVVSSVFARAEAIGTGAVFCYVNCDIVLTSELIDGLAEVRQRKRRFLLGGRCWNLNVVEPISFEGNWEESLRFRVDTEGVLRSRAACDFFAYPRGLWSDLPPLALGRCWVDSALMYRARRSGAALIDGTGRVLTVHQNHPYAPRLRGSMYLENPESTMNIVLAGGPKRLYTWANATHVLSRSGLKRYARGYCRAFGPLSPLENLIPRTVRSFKNNIRSLRSVFSRFE